MGRKGLAMSEALWTQLEKVDVLRERMGIGYAEAMQALEAAGGDVVKALANLENGQSNGQGNSADVWRHRGKRLLEGLQDKMEDWNRTRINLKHQDRTFISVSAPLGAALAYAVWRRPALRTLGLLGVVGALAGDYSLEIEKQHDLSPDLRRAAAAQTELGI